MNDVRKNEIQIALSSIAERCATANIKVVTSGEFYVRDKLTDKIYKLSDFVGDENANKTN